MNKQKYIEEEIAVTVGEARSERAKQMRRLRSEIDRRKAQLKDARDELARFRAAPMRMKVKKYVTLNPGDPGYDETPIGLNHYHGDFKWINIRND